MKETEKQCSETQQNELPKKSENQNCVIQNPADFNIADSENHNSRISKIKM